MDEPSSCLRQTAAKAAATPYIAVVQQLLHIARLDVYRMVWRQEIRMTAAKISVWDPIIRIIHWLLAAAVLFNWYTDQPLWLHTWTGYLAAVLVTSRVVWGCGGALVRKMHGL